MTRERATITIMVNFQGDTKEFTVERDADHRATAASIAKRLRAALRGPLTVTTFWPEWRQDITSYSPRFKGVTHD